MKTKISLTDMTAHETILLFGKAKVGKTHATCSFMEACIEHGGNVFYISTDNGLKRTALEYFGDKFNDFSSKINHYFLHDISDITEIVKDIKENVKSNDLIVVDLFSHIWEMCQHKFIETASGGDVVGYIEKASRDSRKFGMFDSSKWLYIKKIDSIFIKELIITPPCKVIGVCAEKGIEFDRMHKNTKVVDRYGAVGGKPAGQPELTYHFNTIIYIGELRDSKYFCVLGDRGSSKKLFERRSYGRNFWKTFKEYRDGVKRNGK